MASPAAEEAEAGAVVAASAEAASQEAVPAAAEAAAGKPRDLFAPGYGLRLLRLIRSGTKFRLRGSTSESACRSHLSEELASVDQCILRYGNAGSIIECI